MTPDSQLTLELAIGAVIALSLLTLGFMGYAFVLHLRSIRVGRRRRALEDRWMGRLLDAATGESSVAPDQDDPSREEATVPEIDRVLFLELVTSYARALDGPERRNVERLGAPYLGALEPLLTDSDPYRRAYALDILGELGYEEGREPLLQGLADKSALVAMVAARALARRGEPTDVPLILDQLDTFASWSRNYLATLLASFGSDASPYLRRLATDVSADARFRSIALHALRELNDMDAVAATVRILSSESDPEVQGEILRLAAALGKPGDLEHIRPFATAGPAHVRAAALRAVANLSDRRTTDVEMVSRGLDDPSPWVALQAAHGLLQLGRRDDLAALAGSSSPRASLAAEVLESTP